MTLPVKLILSVLTSYVIGSIPTAYWFGRVVKGIDIREHGSGNVGATNAFRVLGKWPGTLVLVIDILKGVVATALIADLYGLHHKSDLYYVILGLVVVCGHNWTCFLRFKGGKGIATSLGVLIGLAIKLVEIRPVLLITVLTWLGIFLVSGFVSLASILAAIVLPWAMVLTDQPLPVTSLGIVFCVFVIFRHRPNIKRLFSGKEPRVKLSFRKNK